MSLSHVKLINNITDEKLLSIVKKIQKEEIEIQNLLKTHDNLRMDAPLITSFLWNWDLFNFKTSKMQTIQTRKKKRNYTLAKRVIFNSLLDIFSANVPFVLLQF